ncbi:hypothetical protein Q2T94_06305 [Paeniglutamicibacter sulfureus]|uniref:hypothetical protein n=1 Tax=Paeniglutamicibacter sulfureus TaxID=43666 RepID=UPI002666C5BE|nr:hypothetical protein [Paeniglutamicibacter sulfureus]MDO2933911.1 hypothetical protein [Paeniglutamicibacter sulfureus]
MKRAGILALSLFGAGVLVTGCTSPDAICNTGKPDIEQAMDHLVDSTLAGDQIEACRVTTTGGTDTVGEQFDRLGAEFERLGVAAGYSVEPVSDSTMGHWSQLTLSTPSHPEGERFDVFERGGNYTIGWLEFEQEPLPSPTPSK